MDKEKLTRGGAGPTGLPQDDVEIPGVGIVRVRAMNRGEMLMLAKISEEHGQARAEQYMLSCALIDPADMTQEDVAAWQESSPGMETHAVVVKVQELSGASQGAPKSDVPSDGERPVD